MPTLQAGQAPAEANEPTPADLAAQAKAAAAGGTVEPAPSQESQQPAGTEPAAAADAKPEESKDGKDGELPAWARNQVESANREAASYRTKLRDAEAEVEKLKPLATENASLKDQLSVAQVAVERSEVVSQFNLPKDLAALLQGNTREDLTKSAELLARHVVPTSTQTVFRQPSGGLDPFKGDDGINGRSAYEAAKKQQR